MLSYLAQQILKRIDPEKAHDIAKRHMIAGRLAPGSFATSESCFLFGTELPNLLGLAAGFDKNAELLGTYDKYGFGFIEVGSVTYLGGDGNPKPRLFRVNQRDVMNRMGLNGIAAHYVAERLRNTLPRNLGGDLGGVFRGPKYGVNIAKTHSPDIMGDNAIRDVQETYRLVCNLGFYTVLNISCPNTREGRTFEDPACLGQLLAAIVEVQAQNQAHVPVLVKCSPVVKDITNVIEICQRYKISGYVISNTIPHEHPQFGKGGLSGDNVRPLAISLTKQVKAIDPNTTVIGVGGIFTGKHIKEFIDAGASVVEAYNGFVRGPNSGPKFAHKVLREYYRSYAYEIRKSD